MTRIYYSTHFIRKVKKLSPFDQSLLSSKIDVFRTDSNNPKLKVHALTGKCGIFSFSLDYSASDICKKEKDTVLFVVMLEVMMRYIDNFVADLTDSESSGYLHL